MLRERFRPAGQLDTHAGSGRRVPPTTNRAVLRALGALLALCALALGAAADNAAAAPREEEPSRPTSADSGAGASAAPVAHIARRTHRRRRARAHPHAAKRLHRRLRSARRHASARHPHRPSVFAFCARRTHRPVHHARRAQRHRWHTRHYTWHTHRTRRPLHSAKRRHAAHKACGRSSLRATAQQAAQTQAESLAQQEAALSAAQRPVPTGPIEEMAVGLDAGGFGPEAFRDVAGAAKYVRLEARFATDSEVGGAADAGVRVGSWLFDGGGIKSIAAINPAALAAEIVTVFKRYGKGGTFWAGRPDLGATNAELLNEPGVPSIWSDSSDILAYAHLSQVVHAALEANFPPATRPKLLLSFDGGAGNTDYGRAVLAAGGVADGVTVHPYGGVYNPTISAQGRRELVVQAYEATHLPVFVTEVGWPTAVGQPETGDSLQWSEQQQAENITNFIRWARSTHFVAMVIYFNYVDYGSNMWYGIERLDRSHKLAYAALAGA